jgi:hypothetical protein
MITGVADGLDTSLTTSTRILAPFSLARRAVDEMVGLTGSSWCLKNRKSIVFPRDTQLPVAFGGAVLRLPIQREFLEEVEDFHLL